MRIVNKQEFEKLPPGTLFALYEPYCLEELEIKGAGKDKMDSAALRGCFTHAEQSVSLLDLLESHSPGYEYSGESIAMTQANYVENDYEESQLFAVWEQADIQFLIGLLFSAYDKAVCYSQRKVDS